MGRTDHQRGAPVGRTDDQEADVGRRRIERRLSGGRGRPGWRRTAGPSLLLLSIGLAALGGCSSSGGGASAGSGGPGSTVGTTAPAGSPVSVPLGQVASAGGGASVPTVVVGVGTSKPLTVVLDTGSVGLHVYGTSLDPAAAGLQPVGRTDTIDYADGTTQSGPIFSGSFTIGGITSAGPVELGVIDAMGCTPAQPSCPGAAGPGAFTTAGIDGTLGIGLDADDPVNPVQLLPVPYGQRWSVHLTADGGTLVLGAPAPTDPVAVITLPPGPPDPDGSPTFADRQASVCWTIAGSSPQCVPTLFDSGSSRTRLSGSPFGSAPVDGSGRLLAGTPFALATGGSGPGAPAATPWTTTVAPGSEPLVAPGGPLGANTGAAVFTATTVTFDGLHGTISIGR